MTIKNRLQQLEKKAPKAPIKFNVRIVDEITDEMRQAQREAHARGERYYIIEPTEEE